MPAHATNSKMSTGCRYISVFPLLLVLLSYISSSLGAVGIPVDLWAHRNEGRWVVDGRWWFFELNSTRHLWPDHYTIFAYGFNAYFNLGPTGFSILRSPVWPSKSELTALPEGPPIATKWDNHPNAMMLALTKSNASLGSFSNHVRVKDESLLFERQNVGLLYRPRHGDWIVASPAKVARLAAANASSLASPNISHVAAWLHAADQQTPAAAATPKTCKGGDPRLLAMEDGRTILVTSHHNPAIDRMEATFAELTVNTTDSSIACINSVVTLSSQDEKNWSPFEFQGRLYFIASVSPFHVVNVTVVDPQLMPRHTALLLPGERVGVVSTVTLSHLHPATCMQWPWSTHRIALRGGTQVIRLDDGSYLALFHSTGNCSAEDYGTLQVRPYLRPC